MTHGRQCQMYDGIMTFMMWYKSCLYHYCGESKLKMQVLSIFHIDIFNLKTFSIYSRSCCARSAKFSFGQTTSVEYSLLLCDISETIKKNIGPPKWEANGVEIQVFFTGNCGIRMRRRREICRRADISNKGFLPPNGRKKESDSSWMERMRRNLRYLSDRKVAIMVCVFLNWLWHN